MRHFLLSTVTGLAALVAIGDAHADRDDDDRGRKHHRYEDFRRARKQYGYVAHPRFSTGRVFVGVRPTFAIQVYRSPIMTQPYLPRVYEAAPAYAPPMYRALDYAPPAYQPAPAYAPPAYQPAPVYTPPASALPADPAALVRQWYRRYLGREGDPGGVATWVDSLRQGNPPEAVLATILASDEYYGRAGGSPEGLVQALFADLAGRGPAGEEYGYWLDRLSRGHRVDVIHDLLLRYPPN